MALSALPFDRFVLDGEIVVPDENGRYPIPTPGVTKVYQGQA